MIYLASRRDSRAEGAARGDRETTHLRHRRAAALHGVISGRGRPRVRHRGVLTRAPLGDYPGGGRSPPNPNPRRIRRPSRPSPRRAGLERVRARSRPRRRIARLDHRAFPSLASVIQARVASAPSRMAFRARGSTLLSLQLQRAKNPGDDLAAARKPAPPKGPILIRRPRHNTPSLATPDPTCAASRRSRATSRVANSPLSPRLPPSRAARRPRARDADHGTTRRSTTRARGARPRRATTSLAHDITSACPRTRTRRR